MKLRLRKIFIGAALLLAVLVVVLAVLGLWRVRRPWPQHGDTLAIAGLAAEVEAVRVLAEVEPMALRWTALDRGRLAEALIRLNLAGDCLCQSVAEIEYFDCELPRVRRQLDDPEAFLDRPDCRSPRP